MCLFSENFVAGMSKKRILFISQEITPFIPESQMSNTCRILPQGIHEKGKEIRVFMPRFGKINERRHQLHEVIRLSGMNMIVNDSDHPLIIKVASIPTARVQVYFIDNEEYFHRKAYCTDENGKQFEDNDERSMFFVRGVLETVKKLGWVPDIIHCHGWMSALAPLYVKKLYHEDPHFSDAKVVYSVYNDGFTEGLDKDLQKKISFDGISEEDTETISDPSFVNLSKLAIEYSDAVVKGTEEINGELSSYLSGIDKPLLAQSDNEGCVGEIDGFYDEVLEGKSELIEE